MLNLVAKSKISSAQSSPPQPPLACITDQLHLISVNISADILDAVQHGIERITPLPPLSFSSAINS
jgi:hypothetical protein